MTYVKASSGNGHVYIGARRGNLDGVSFTGNSERQVNEGPGNGVSLSMGALRRERGDGRSFTGDSKR